MSEVKKPETGLNEDAIVPFVQETISRRLRKLTEITVASKIWGMFFWDPKPSHMTFVLMIRGCEKDLYRPKRDSDERPCPSFAVFRRSVLQMDGMMIDDRYKINVTKSFALHTSHGGPAWDLAVSSLTLPCCGTALTDFETLVSCACPRCPGRWAHSVNIEFALEDRLPSMIAHQAELVRVAREKLAGLEGTLDMMKAKLAETGGGLKI